MRNPTLAEPELQTTDKGPPRLPAKQAKLRDRVAELTARYDVP